MVGGFAGGPQCPPKRRRSAAEPSRGSEPALQQHQPRQAGRGEAERGQHDHRGGLGFQREVTLGEDERIAVASNNLELLIKGDEIMKDCNQKGNAKYPK